AALVAAAESPHLGLELVAMVPIGAASTAFIATSNSILQLETSDQMRGRVMALFAMVFLGSTPIGGPLVGWFAGRFGPRSAFLLSGVATLVAGLLALYGMRRARRRATPSLDEMTTPHPAPELVLRTSS